jgi:hypothetical protein
MRFQPNRTPVQVQQQGKTKTEYNDNWNEWGKTQAYRISDIGLEGRGLAYYSFSTY